MLKTLLVIFLCLAGLRAYGGDVEIVSADFQRSGNGTWSVNVALLHADSGWDHYADIWRVVDAEGNILGERVLLHPHEDEQPFIRGESGIEISESLERVYIEAHDMVHGWTPNRMEVDMTKAVRGRLLIRNN